MAKQHHRASETHSRAPSVLPFGWQRVGTIRGALFFRRDDGLRVAFSVSGERDGKRWLHVSASRADSIPSWGDLRDVKSVFIGDDAVALQVLPRETEYVNHHPYVLHLWHCLDGDVTPDFRDDEGLI